jgi:hypothetical protein
MSKDTMTLDELIDDIKARMHDFQRAECSPRYVIGEIIHYIESNRQALEADSRRLEWLFKNCWIEYHTKDGVFSTDSREAIDAAMEISDD